MKLYGGMAVEYRNISTLVEQHLNTGCSKMTSDLNSFPEVHKIPIKNVSAGLLLANYGLKRNPQTDRRF